MMRPSLSNPQEDLYECMYHLHHQKEMHIFHHQLGALEEFLENQTECTKGGHFHEKEDEDEGTTMELEESDQPPSKNIVISLMEPKTLTIMCHLSVNLSTLKE